MPRSHSRGRDHLRLVERPTSPGLPAPLTDPAGRREVEPLTDALVSGLIEMMDLDDADPDAEPSSDEFENDQNLL